MSELPEALCHDSELLAGLQRYMQAREAMFATSRTVSISEMATTLAHEINTPIATLSNLVQGLKARLGRDPSIAPDIMKALDSAGEQALFTSDVIKRIRDYTQARAPSREVLNTGQLLEEAASLLDWYFSLHSCRIEVADSIVRHRVLGDRVMLQQVVLNILKNAADAMIDTPMEHRIIKVLSEVHGDRLRIIIRDFGPGLHEARDTLFTPFVTSKPEGMGVGLNICRSFLDLHGGRLWLADAEDGGCKSIIELPVHEVSTE